jgi:Tfp pilus assembly pilus retraction ATPase PilT
MLQAGGRYGMVQMDMSLVQLVRSGQISLDMALERCGNEEDLRRLLGG